MLVLTVLLSAIAYIVVGMVTAPVFTLLWAKKVIITTEAEWQLYRMGQEYGYIYPAAPGKVFAGHTEALDDMQAAARSNGITTSWDTPKRVDSYWVHCRSLGTVLWPFYWTAFLGWLLGYWVCYRLVFRNVDRLGALIEGYVLSAIEGKS